jgi:hypothetical protein
MRSRGRRGICGCSAIAIWGVFFTISPRCRELHDIADSGNRQKPAAQGLSGG